MIPASAAIAFIDAFGPVPEHHPVRGFEQLPAAALGRCPLPFGPSVWSPCRFSRPTQLSCDLVTPAQRNTLVRRGADSAAGRLTEATCW